jgi:hypothetical protein
VNLQGEQQQQLWRQSGPCHNTGPSASF